MQAFLKATLAFLGLNPFFLGAISAMIFAAGAVLQADQNRTNMAKVQALLDGPPPVVAAKDIGPAAAAHPFGEVSVKAQLDRSMEYDIVLTGDGPDRYGYMVPLVSADATGADTAEVFAVLLMDDAMMTMGPSSGVDFGPRAEGEGAFGPILMLNGMVGDLGGFDGAVEEIFAGEFRDMPADLPVLRSFEGQRAAAYDPAWPFEMSIFGVFAWFGGAVGLYALFRSAVHFRPNRSDTSAGGAEAADDADPFEDGAVATA